MKRLLQALCNRFRRAAGRSFEAEMEEEIRFHLEMRAARNQEAGMDAAAAGLQARRGFGHMDGVREACRDQRSFEFLREVVKDARYGWRAMMRTPALTIAAALALGVGVGLMSVELSFVRGVRSTMPIREPGRVREICIQTRKGYTMRAIARKDYEAWRVAQRSFSDTGAISEPSDVDLSGPGMYARSLSARALSFGAVRTLGVKPALGRLFNADDERAASPLTIVLSYEIWKADFGAAPSIVGRRFGARVGLWGAAGDGPSAPEEATVIGVMPPGFSTGQNTDCWLSATGKGRVNVVARLRDGVRPETASAELATQGAAFETPKGDTAHSLMALPLDGGVNPAIMILFSTLFGVVAGVLALACVNVGALLAMRTLERGRELALRMALGATRGRLIRQMLVESAMLAALAAAVGIPLAWVGVNLLDRQLALDPSKPAWIRLQLDGAAVAAMLLASLIAALAAGFVPALRAARMDASAALKNGAWGSSVRLGRLTRGLVTFQSAAACALLLVTGLLLNALLSYSRFDAPYDPERVLSAGVFAHRYGKAPAAMRALDQALERARALPGVEAAALTSVAPMSMNIGPVTLRGDDPENRASEGRYVGDLAVSPEYFALLRASIREGRGFTAADRDGGEPVAVVNESMARLLTPGRSLVGRQFRSGDDGPWLTIVGVCADLPSIMASNSVFYRPIAQEQARGAYLLLRTAVDPHGLIRPLRDAVRAFDPDLPMEQFFTVAEAHDRQVATLRALGALAGAFALSALALAAVGIYGVTGFSVRKRMREFGIRVALGASPMDMAKLTLGRGMMQLALSLSAGALLGWWASRPMMRLLKDMAGEVPPAAYVIILAVVAVSTFAALWLPAREATKVDPAETLRAE